MNSDLSSFAQLAPAYPELLLAVGVIVLLLAGVTLNSFFSALILFVQYLSDFAQTYRALRWLMGIWTSRGTRRSCTRCRSSRCRLRHSPGSPGR